MYNFGERPQITKWQALEMDIDYKRLMVGSTPPPFLFLSLSPFYLSFLSLGHAITSHAGQSMMDRRSRFQGRASEVRAQSHLIKFPFSFSFFLLLAFFVCCCFVLGFFAQSLKYPYWFPPSGAKFAKIDMGTNNWINTDSAFEYFPLCQSKFWQKKKKCALKKKKKIPH